MTYWYMNENMIVAHLDIMQAESKNESQHEPCAKKTSLYKVRKESNWIG